MEKNLNWAVLGTGVIANEMAQALKAMGKTLYAVGNRTHEKAVTFAEKYQVAKVYDELQKRPGIHEPGRTHKADRRHPEEDAESGSRLKLRGCCRVPRQDGGVKGHAA